MEKIYNTCKACGNFYYFYEGASSEEMKFCSTCIDVRHCTFSGNGKLVAKPKPKKLSKIAEMNAAAKSMGMSYGQYMGWLRQGMPK